MVTEKSTALYERMRITTISSQEAITQVNIHRRPNMLRKQSYLSSKTQTKGMEC